MERPWTRWIVALLLCLLATPAFAYDVEEFNDGPGAWSTSPKRIGRSSTPGWKAVRNDGEKALKTSPTGTRYTYYWKLTRTFDLENGESPELDLKMHFKGHNYAYVQVQVGDENARRNADFSTLYEQIEPTADAEDLRLDLSEWAGTTVKVRVVLKKPHGVVESRIGLYVHRIGVVTLIEHETASDDLSMLSLGGFNIQVFGRSKMGKAQVPDVLAAIISRFDLVVVQEIRDSSGEAIETLHEMVNRQGAGDYALALSDRLGRTNSKEQYAIFYRPNKLTLIDAFHHTDADDRFEREPYVAPFETVEGGFDFGVVALHADPDMVPDELDAIDAVFDEAWDLWGEEDLVLIGNLNASCGYLNEAEQSALPLWSDAANTVWIGDEADTTVATSRCAYDRIVSRGELTDLIVPGSGATFYFDQAYALSPSLTKQVSDHYPVEVLVDLAGIGGG